MAQCAEYGVGGAANTALQGQERRRYDAALHVAEEELCHVVAYLVGHGVRVLEGPCLVGYVAFNHAYDFLGVYFNVRLAYAVVDVRDGYWLAQRRVKRLVYVVQELGVLAVERVKLQYDVLGQACHGGAYAACGG